MAVSAEAMLGRFKGCMLGALVGDCLGAPFEMEKRVAHSVLNKYIAKLADPNLRVPYKAYTDDNAMTRCVAQSFIDKKKFDELDMAKKFVKEFYAEPNRGYGGNIIDVFAALKATKYKDVWAPGALQFGGTGSWGNGGAMRVSPVALFTVRQTEQLSADGALVSALITHSNPLGVNGAVLQCLAVRCALLTGSNTMDPLQFAAALATSLSKITVRLDDDQSVYSSSAGGKEYMDKLRVLQDLLKRPDEPTRDEVVEKLGNNISALGSVPTAIYAFLKSLQPIQGIESDSEFLRAILYSISLGGDTDTIASMAGAIAGAYHGSSAIPEFLSLHCEGWTDALLQATLLHATVHLTEAQQG